jgi:hypothetical protein
VENSDTDLAIQVSAAVAADMRPMPPTLERSIFEAVARVCQGQFEWLLTDQILQLTLRLQKVKARHPQQRKQKETT